MMSEEFSKAGGFAGWGSIKIGTEKEEQPVQKTEEQKQESKPAKTEKMDDQKEEHPVKVIADPVGVKVATDAEQPGAPSTNSNDEAKQT